MKGLKIDSGGESQSVVCFQEILIVNPREEGLQLLFNVYSGFFFAEIVKSFPSGQMKINQTEIVFILLLTFFKVIVNEFR